MRGSISKIETLLPKREKADANSTPTAPAPRIASDFGTSRQIQNFDVGEDAAGIRLEARQHARFRTRGQHDVLGLQDLLPAVGGHFHLAGTGQARRSP